MSQVPLRSTSDGRHYLAKSSQSKGRYPTTTTRMSGIPKIVAQGADQECARILWAITPKTLYAHSHTIMNELVLFDYGKHFDDGLEVLPLLWIRGGAPKALLVMMSAFMKRPIVGCFLRCECPDADIEIGSLVHPCTQHGF